MHRRIGGWSTAVAVVLMAGILALGLTACGGSDGSSSSGTSGETEGSGGEGSGAVTAASLKEAKRTLEIGLQPPAHPTVEVPLTKRPPEGKAIAYVAFSGPIAEINFEGLQAAAKEFGWTAKAFYTGSTADEFQAAFNAAAAMNPDGVWVSSLEPTLWKTYAEKWESEGVPVINQATSWPDVEGKKFNFITIPTNNKLIGRMGDWAIADSGGEKIGVVTVTAPEIPAFKEIGNTVSERVQHLCASCSTEVLNVRLSDVGKAIPQEVVSFLQRNPDTKYVVFGIGDLGTGVPQAITAAGLSGIQIGSVAPSPPQRAELKEGALAIELAYDQYSQGYVVVDFLARSMTGQSTKPDFEWEFATQFHTQETVGDPNETWSAPGAAEKWSAIWKGE